VLLLGPVSSAFLQVSGLSQLILFELVLSLYMRILMAL
jgi:hypothetical protein